MKVLLATFFLLVNIVNTACSQLNQQNQLEGSVPFEVITSSGKRPVIRAQVNELPVILVIHSNAGFSMQLSHEAADKAKISDRVQIDSYGITQPGTVSPLGRDSAFVNQFTVGTRIFSHVPISIFETVAPVYNQGMLGLRWLTTNNILIDYTQNRLFINPSNQTIEYNYKSLFEKGYVTIPMQRSRLDGRYSVIVSIDGRAQPMVISTVADNYIDIEFAKRAKIDFEDSGSRFGGPSGATGKIYRTKQAVRIQLASIAFMIGRASVEDTYAYIGGKRPAELTKEIGGMLGAEFLIDNQAIVDFGHSVLYLKKQK